MDLNEIKTIEDADEYIDLLFTEYEIGVIDKECATHTRDFSHE